MTQRKAQSSQRKKSLFISRTKLIHHPLLVLSVCGKATTNLFFYYLYIMKSLQDIRNALSVNKKRLFDKYGLRRLAIFGSYTRNQQNDNSDVDILVEFEKPVGIEFIDLALDLENILHTKVDLVSKNGLKPKYFQSISAELNYV
ncbi:MAG: nucleotidyltransferase family protein [Bacteroidota bacterium]